MIQIKKEHLNFAASAAIGFSENKNWETYQDADYPGLLALRMGADRDCVEVYEIGKEVANFVQMLEPQPAPEKEAMDFIFYSAKLNKEKNFTYSFEQGLIGSISAAADQLKGRIGKTATKKEAQETAEIIAYLVATSASLGARMLKNV
ncbi:MULTISPECIES: hypothetical protein [unclassified Sporosarcina]|uniref:hypothetical protein n=1 Tax=unclassified Sporosarcina TaxID=2647733 RepID=UPI00204224B5|nr:MULTISPECIES: hypothetical protein [unclassified Sporosarcina]GKV66722.1 hypothetical protein NCCP2331_28750 [Sporosarcina sp. NCCP-2331]GLB57095.1 hypothetical protein NCCP2378_28820 [Sporosarcina sp. NCCP-2378]